MEFPGSLNRWQVAYNHPIGNIYHLYTTYIIANWVIICYRSHLLREPKTTIEKGVLLKTAFFWIFWKVLSLAGHADLKDSNDDFLVLFWLHKKRIFGVCHWGRVVISWFLCKSWLLFCNYKRFINTTITTPNCWVPGYFYIVIPNVTVVFFAYLKLN